MIKHSGLEDHKLKKGKFITPFNDALGNLVGTIGIEMRIVCKFLYLIIPLLIPERILDRRFDQHEFNTVLLAKISVRNLSAIQLVFLSSAYN